MSPEEGAGANIARAGITEAVGTFVLVFAGTAVAAAAALGLPIAGHPYDSLAVGLTFGLVLAALVAALGHVSGAHLNPAVTLGLSAIGRIRWKYVPVYIVAQVIGAILASMAVWATFGDRARTQASLGATFPTAGTSIWQAFLMEMLITFVLVFVIVSVATDRRANIAASSLAIGLALGVGVLIAGPLTGGSANPARTLGPMIVSGKFTALWVYLVAPVVGALIAAFIYDNLERKAHPPEPSASVTNE